MSDTAPRAMSLTDARSAGISDACYVGAHASLCLSRSCACDCHHCLRHGSRIPCPDYSHATALPPMARK